MGKPKTSIRQRASFLRAQKPKLKGNHMRKKKQKESNRVLRDDAKLKEHDPMKSLLDTKKMGAAVMECLIENDTEGALEIIEIYLDALNRTQFLKDAKIPRSTAYNVFKRRNPTIKTLAKIMHASART
jgi:DNA-binding phage protein